MAPVKNCFNEVVETTHSVISVRKKTPLILAEKNKQTKITGCKISVRSIFNCCWIFNSRLERDLGKASRVESLPEAVWGLWALLRRSRCGWLGPAESPHRFQTGFGEEPHAPRLHVHYIHGGHNTAGINEWRRDKKNVVRFVWWLSNLLQNWPWALEWSQDRFMISCFSAQTWLNENKSL